MSIPNLNAKDALAAAAAANNGDEQTLASEDKNDPFYNEGVSENSKKALDFVDENAKDYDENTEEIYNNAYLKKALTRMEIAYAKNVEERDKFKKEPLKYMESEAELDQAIKALSVISDASSHLYDGLIKSGSVQSLVSLLSHENEDIVERTAIVLSELVDTEDVDQTSVEELSNELFNIGLYNSLKSRFKIENKPHLRNENLAVLSFIENLANTSGRELIKLVPILCQLKPMVFHDNDDEFVPDFHNSMVETCLNIMLNAQSVMNTWEKPEAITVMGTLFRYYEQPDLPATKDDKRFCDTVVKMIRLFVRDSNCKELARSAECLGTHKLLMMQSPYIERRCWEILESLMTGNNNVAESALEAIAMGYNDYMQAYLQQSRSMTVLRGVMAMYSAMLKYAEFDTEDRNVLVDGISEQLWRRMIRLRNVLAAQLEKGDGKDYDLDEQMFKNLNITLGFLIHEIPVLETVLKSSGDLVKIKKSLLELADGLSGIASIEEVPDESEDSYFLANQALEAKEEMELLRELASNIDI